MESDRRRGRIDYVGDYRETRINVARPDPRASFNGHRYETPRLIVDVTHTRCNDAMSGHGYADTVVVTADGKVVNGCGGTRRTDWDM
jgi:heat shock protein HslJ